VRERENSPGEIFHPLFETLYTRKNIMMRMSNIKMQTTVKRDDLLAALKKNFEVHSKIVKEAKEGYLKKAKEAIAKKMKLLEKGKIAPLSFLNLHIPVDFSEVYKTSIKMLEWNTEKDIVLNADEFRQLVEDKWDWSDHFLASNSHYSSTASAFFGGVSASWEQDSDGEASE
jgi:hypothetical protein